MATATGSSDSKLGILLEREERTEELAFEQLRSLGKCWICLSGRLSRGSRSGNQDTVPTPPGVNVVKRILKRDEGLRPFLHLFQEKGGGSLSLGPTRAEKKVVTMLMQSCCHFCRSVFDALVRLEEEVQTIEEGIGSNLKVLLERRRRNTGFSAVSRNRRSAVQHEDNDENGSDDEDLDLHARRGRPPGLASKRKRTAVGTYTKEAELGSLETATEFQEVSGSALQGPLLPADDSQLEDEDMGVEIPHFFAEADMKEEPLSDLESVNEAEIEPDLPEPVTEYPNPVDVSLDRSAEDCEEVDADAENVEQSVNQNDASSSDGNDEDTDGDYEPEPDDEDPDFLDASKTRSRSSGGTKKKEDSGLEYPEIKDRNNIVCPACPEDQRIKYVRLSYFKDHYKKVHLKILLPCPYCPKKVTTKFILRRHIARHHAGEEEFQLNNNLTPATVLKTYECPKCAKKLYSKYSWVGHQIMQCGIEVDLDSLPFKMQLFTCTFPGCDVRCYTTRKFKIHQQTHKQDGKPFACPNDCGKRFTRAESIKGHVEFACSRGIQSKRPDPPKEPKSISRLSGKKVHECPHCSRKFTTRVPFTNHVKSCRNITMELQEAGVIEPDGPKVKPRGVCDICNKSMLLSEIPSHKKRVHLKEKNFICQYCGKGFFARYSLNHHVQKRHEKDDDPKPV